MFTINTTSDKDYYIINKDSKEFARVSKTNDLEDVKRYFGIEEVEKPKIRLCFRCYNYFIRSKFIYIDKIRYEYGKVNVELCSDEKCNGNY